MTLALDRAAVTQVERALARDPERERALADEVARLLGATSVLLRLAPDGRLRGVTVLGAGGVPPPAPSEPVDPLDRPFAVAPDGMLARVAETTTLTGRQLADLALRQTDPSLRAEAVGVAVDAAMRDPELERAMLAALDGLDDATLAAALRGIAGDGAAGIAALVTERARGRPLGRRAANVLDRLRP